MLYSFQRDNLGRALFFYAQSASNKPTVSEQKHPLNFNFGFLLESNFGAKRDIELDHTHIELGDDVSLATLKGTFTATRTSSGIYINGTLNTDLPVQCARCLDDLIVAENLELDDLFFYPPSDAPEGEHIVEDGGYVSLRPIIRDLGVVATPMQTVCREDCAGLCETCGENLNKTQCNCEADDIDPRMAALKALLDDNK